MPQKFYRRFFSETSKSLLKLSPHFKHFGANASIPLSAKSNFSLNRTNLTNLYALEFYCPYIQTNNNFVQKSYMSTYLTWLINRLLTQNRLLKRLSKYCNKGPGS